MSSAMSSDEIKSATAHEVNNNITAINLEYLANNV